MIIYKFECEVKKLKKKPCLPKQTAYFNGKIITMDDDDSIVEALLVVDDKIAAVGSTEEILSLASDTCERVDLKGKSVIPGLIDGHVHAGVTTNGYINCLNIQTPPYESLEQIFEALRKKVAETPKGEWIMARGSFDGQNKVKEKRLPTRQELDAISTEHPIMLNFEVHMNVLNTYAMKLMGWTHETLIPKYASMGRDQVTGEPTGAFTEIDVGLPKSPWGYEPWIKAFKEGLPKYYVSHGVTSIHEIPMCADSIKAMQDLRKNNELPLRVRLYMTHPNLIDLDEFLRSGIRQGFGDEWLNVGGIKLFADGCSYHANMHPYCDLKWTQKDLDEVVEKIHRAGMQVFIHSLTPKGVEISIKAIEKAVKKYPRKDHRHRVEHAGDRIYRFADNGVLYDTAENVLNTMKENGIIPIMTPQFMRDNEPNQGPPMRKMIDDGFIFPGNTDSTGSEVEVANPWYGIWLLVKRENMRGVVDQPDQRITPLEAIRMFTKWAAWGGFEENIKGSLENGKLADMVILKKDPLTCDVDELRTMEVEQVIIGGKKVYSAEDIEDL